MFGVARFGEAQFGGVSVPVPFMPLWAIILLAVALWVVVYFMRNKEI
jgi:cobalamin biosynthesis Mg chelatase CobN